MMEIRWFDRIRGLLSGERSDETGAEGARLRAEVVGFYQQGRIAEATEVARRLVDWQRRILGAEHPDYAQGLSNLAMLLQKQGDDHQAAALLERVIVIRRESLGENHPETARAEAFLGTLRRASAIEPVSASLEPEPTDTGRVARSGALAVLDRILALEYTGPGELSALGDCQRAATELRSEIEAGACDETVSLLVAGKHPFAALLALAGPSEALNDALWAEYHEAVRQAFGRPLAAAASRGQLHGAPRSS